jgi:hypothetical protein
MRPSGHSSRPARDRESCWYQAYKLYLVGSELIFDTTVLYKHVGDTFGAAVLASARLPLGIIRRHGIEPPTESRQSWECLSQTTITTRFSPQLATACALLWGDDRVQALFQSPARAKFYTPMTTEELLENALVHFGNEHAQGCLDTTCIYSPTKKEEEHILELPGVELTNIDTSGCTLFTDTNRWTKSCQGKDIIVFFASLCGFAQVGSSNCACTSRRFFLRYSCLPSAANSPHPR